MLALVRPDSPTPRSTGPSPTATWPQRGASRSADRGRPIWAAPAPRPSTLETIGWTFRRMDGWDIPLPNCCCSRNFLHREPSPVTVRARRDVDAQWYPGVAGPGDLVHTYSPTGSQRERVLEHGIASRGDNASRGGPSAGHEVATQCKFGHWSQTIRNWIQGIEDLDQSALGVSQRDQPPV